jgi:hypothetical protein
MDNRNGIETKKAMVKRILNRGRENGYPLAVYARDISIKYGEQFSARKVWNLLRDMVRKGEIKAWFNGRNVIGYTL